MLTAKVALQDSTDTDTDSGTTHKANRDMPPLVPLESVAVLVAVSMEAVAASVAVLVSAATVAPQPATDGDTGSGTIVERDRE